MKIKKFYYEKDFSKSLKKYSSSEKKRIKDKIQLFLNNPFNPSLKTHKLKGKLKNYWSFSITYNLRILFEFIGSQTVGFIDIGTHEIYHFDSTWKVE